jgi:hypothetical protein
MKTGGGEEEEWAERLTVVQGRRNTARTDIIGVLGCPTNIDGMTIRVREQGGDEDESRPLILDQPWPENQSDDARKRPDWLEDAYQGTLICLLANPSDTQQGNDMEDIGRNGEKIGVELVRS